MFTCSAGVCPAISPDSPELNSSVAAQDLALAGSWWLLAIVSLGVSTFCAVILVVARTPFLGLGAEFFRTALVLHVDFAVLVWFLAVAAGVWLVAIPVRCCVLARVPRFGIWLAGGGALAMLVAPIVDSGTPILANYIPVLDSSLFYAGLGVFLAGIALVGVACLASLPAAFAGGTLEWYESGWRWAVGASILAFWGAIVVFVLAQGYGDDVSLDGRLWGGGHVLQILHTLMLMAAWMYLGKSALQYVDIKPWVILALIFSELVAVLADLLIALVWQVDSVAYRKGFTEVMRWATWPAPICLAGFLVLGYVRQAGFCRFSLVHRSILFSIALFVLGCLVGASIRGETTSVPAHYHGTVGAVSLAYMLLGRTWLEKFDLTVRAGWAWRWQPLIYGSGIGLMVLGLAWAGQLGVPRKSPHAELVLIEGWHHFAMGIAGIGGLLATSGAAIFVLSIAMAILKRRKR